MIPNSNQKKLFNVSLADLGRFSNQVTPQRRDQFINAYENFVTAQQNGLPREIQLLINHNRNTTGPKTWDCPIADCDKKCKSKQLLVEHGYHSRAHNGVTVPCILCDMNEMDQASNYRKHLISVHEHGLNGEPIKEMPCPYCGEMLKPGRNGNRIRHMESERCRIQRAALDDQFPQLQSAPSVQQHIRNVDNFNFNNPTPSAQMPQQQPNLLAQQQFGNASNFDFDFNNTELVYNMENLVDDGDLDQLNLTNAESFTNMKSLTNDDDFNQLNFNNFGPVHNMESLSNYVDFDALNFNNDSSQAHNTDTDPQWMDFDTTFNEPVTADVNGALNYADSSDAESFTWDGYMDVTEVEAGQKAAKERADEKKRRAEALQKELHSQNAQTMPDGDLTIEEEFYELAEQLQIFLHDN